MTYNDNPESSSSNPEALLRLQCIELAQGIVTDLQAKRALLKDTKKPRIAQYVEVPSPTDLVPAPHFLVSLVPYPNHDPVDGISTIFLRTLTPYYYFRLENGDDERVETDQYNDIFIEVVRGRDEPREYYFMNSSTMTPYETAEDFTKNPVDAYYTGDLFLYTGDISSIAPRLEQYPPLNEKRLLWILDDGYARLNQKT